MHVSPRCAPKQSAQKKHHRHHRRRRHRHRFLFLFACSDVMFPVLYVRPEPADPTDPACPPHRRHQCCQTDRLLFIVGCDSFSVPHMSSIYPLVEISRSAACFFYLPISSDVSVSWFQVTSGLFVSRFGWSDHAVMNLAHDTSKHKRIAEDSNNGRGAFKVIREK